MINFERLEKLNELKTVISKYEKLGGSKKRIRCVNNNLEWESLTECAKELGTSVASLKMAMYRKNGEWRGLKFEYVNKNLHKKF